MSDSDPIDQTIHAHQRRAFALGQKLDEAKPEHTVGGVVVRALLAVVLWYCFDDRLAESFNQEITPFAIGTWPFSNVFAMTLFLCTIASAGSMVRQSR